MRMMNSRNQRPDTVSLDPESELYLLRERERDDITRNLGLEQEYGQPHPSRTPYGVSPGQNYASGSSFSDLNTLLHRQASSPTARQGEEVEAWDRGNQEAMREGFLGGDRFDKEYENFYGGPGEVTGPRVVAASSRGRSDAPIQQKAEYDRQAQIAKTMMPLTVEQEKTRGALQVDQANYDRLQGLLGRKDNSAPTLDPLNRGQGAAAPPPQSQSWKDYIFGKGPNSLRASGDAANERIKYGVMSTPYAPLLQDVSFANLQQLSGQFPGVRGFQYLMPKLAEHQANVGKGETWQASYQRLVGMDKIMADTEHEFDDPSLRVTAGPDGRPRLAMMPQTVVRGKLSLQDAHQKVQNAIQELERLHPELKGAPTGTGTPGKVYLDDNGNPRGGR